MKSIMKPVNLLLLILITVIMQGCDYMPKNSWQSRPYINAFGEEAGIALYVEGERLTNGLDNAQVSFALTQDLISGGFKEVITFTLNGIASGSEIEVLTPTNEPYLFEIYDGLLFNIDYESNEVARFLELMNHEFLVIKQEEYQFTISTAGFMNLYTTTFLQPNS